MVKITLSINRAVVLTVDVAASAARLAFLDFTVIKHLLDKGFMILYEYSVALLV